VDVYTLDPCLLSISSCAHLAVASNCSSTSGKPLRKEHPASGVEETPHREIEVSEEKNLLFPSLSEMNCTSRKKPDKRFSLSISSRFSEVIGSRYSLYTIPSKLEFSETHLCKRVIASISPLLSRAATQKNAIHHAQVVGK